MSIVHRTIAGVNNVVPATEFVEKLFNDGSVPPMNFSCVDVETVTLLVTSLSVHGVDGLSVGFLKASPHMDSVLLISAICFSIQKM